MRKRFFIPIMLLLVFAVLLGCRYSVQGGLHLFLAVPVSQSDIVDIDVQEDAYGEHVLADSEILTEAVTETAPPSTTYPTDRDDLGGSDVNPVSDRIPVTTDTTQLPETSVASKATGTRQPSFSSETSKSQKASTQTTSTKTSTSKKATTTSKASPTTLPSSLETTTTSQKTTAKVQGTYYQNYEEEVVRLVNVERAKEGLSPLRMDSSLRSSARLRAKEISDCWGHTRPKGQRFCTAIKLSYHKAAENIAAGQQTPEGVVRGWMGSDSHRANIMNPNFKLIGVGCYYDSGTSYKIYWSQLFIAP